MRIATAGTSRTPRVTLEGEIDVATSSELRTALAGLLDAGATSIIVDLTEVTFIDSSGLGVFVSTFKQLRSRDGGMLRLVGPTGNVRKVLEITGLDAVFAIEDRDPSPA